MPENVDDLEKTTGQKILAVLKFITLTLIKMIFVALTLLSLFIAVFGVGFKLMQELCKNGLFDLGNNKIVIVLAGLVATVCFFFTKTFHNILRPYLWPAVGGWTILTAAFVVAVVVFEPDFANALEHRNSGKTEENSTVNENQIKISKYKDDASGLIWSDRSEDKTDWFQAKEYCANLEYDLWRLPTIDELRTLVTNCPGSETGGECQISEEKNRLSSDDWSKQCFCKQAKEIVYSKFGDRIRLWSSSEQTNDDDNAWYVFFSNANVGSDSKNNGYYVRCVIK